MLESDLLKQVRRLGIGAVRLFRNNVGQAWIGPMVRGEGRPMYVGPKDVVIRNARPLHAGLHVGSGDLVGWVSFEVRPEHVGTTIAKFVSIETKTDTGRVSEDQKNWITVVQGAGGLAGVARSVEQARDILEGQ